MLHKVEKYKIKILYVIPKLAKAGTEKHVLSLAGGLDKEKFEVAICCLFVDTNYRKFEDMNGHESVGTNHHELHTNEYESICGNSTCFVGRQVKISGSSYTFICLNRRNVYDLRIMWDLYRLMRKEEFDIVHTYLFGFHILASIPSKLISLENTVKNMITVIFKKDYSDIKKEFKFKRKFIVISSRRQLATWKKWHHIFFTKIGNMFTDKIIANANAVREFAKKQENLSSNKILTIYNGVNLDKFYPRVRNKNLLSEFCIEENIPVIGMIANFSENKNHELLFAVLKLIKKKGIRFKCVLVGEGPLQENLKFKVKSLKLGDEVIFAGSRDDIPEILSIMDVVVLTSKVEGLPNIILEAFACGKPVVAISVGGISEVIKDGENGILVPLDSPDFFANAVIELLDNDKLRKKMGSKSRIMVENKFNLKEMIKQYENLYISLTDK